MRAIGLTLMLLPLAACATPPAPQPSGFLSSYEGLQASQSSRAVIAQRSDAKALKGVAKVAIADPVFASGPDNAWMTDAERAALLREIAAQLCFKMSERYEIAPETSADAVMRTSVTRAIATGRMGAAGAAAVNAMIPGPIGVRAPDALGGLSAEAEMKVKDRQVAALIWNRDAQALGTDDPSLSRIGDALQFAKPFAAAAVKTMTSPKAAKRTIDHEADPCAQFGPRTRPVDWLAKTATGLYMPSSRGADDAAPAAPPAKP